MIANIDVTFACGICGEEIRLSKEGEKKECQSCGANYEMRHFEVVSDGRLVFRLNSLTYGEENEALPIIRLRLERLSKWMFDVNGSVDSDCCHCDSNNRLRRK